jgi:hypothetical protein
MSELTEVGKAFAGWAEENSGLAVDENFEYTDRTVGNFAAAAFAAGAKWQAEHTSKDDPIPMYAQLDIWSALHNPEDVDPAEYDAFRAEHGFADTWAELCAAVRTVARGAGYIHVLTVEPSDAEVQAVAVVLEGAFPGVERQGLARIALEAARKAVSVDE